MERIASLLAGLLFGAGLLLAGMANPAKVLAFLDLAGAWDPSLALVMAGAIAVGLIAFTQAKRMPTTLCGTPLSLPNNRRIDPRLIFGSLLFGVGWGLAGFCPGPAVVALVSGVPKAYAFFAAMLVGMGLFQWFNRPAPARS